MHVIQNAKIDFQLLYFFSLGRKLEGLVRKTVKLMVLVHVCFIYNTAIFVHFDEISEKTWAEPRALTEL